MNRDPHAMATRGAEETLLTLADYERAAERRVERTAWEYISSGAADEVTLRWNREAYERIALVPRALVDVSAIDTSVSLCGSELAHPILLAPTAFHRLIHPEGEAATARGAAAAKALMVLSMASNTAMEEVAAAAPESPRWFQLYISRDQGQMRDVIQRAKASGYKTLCITVDSPVIGTRNREARSGFSIPAHLTMPNIPPEELNISRTPHLPGEEDIYSLALDPAITWKHVEWMIANSGMPVVLKGILHPDDARRAAAIGAAGVIVSNHGGRLLDSVPATIDVLPQVAAAVGGKLPVLVDGGIRRGTDALKALALGATAVLIGRPYMHGLAVNGAEGVARVINILRLEFKMAMALCGKTRLSELGPDLIFRK